MLFEPANGFGVEVVGRFVEQENIGFGKEQSAKCHAAAFTAREVIDMHISRWTTQGIHRLFDARIEIPYILCVDFFLKFALLFDYTIHFFVGHGVGKFGAECIVFVHEVNVFLYTLFDNFSHGFARFKLGLLFQIPYGVAGGEVGFAIEFFIYTSKDAQQRAFTRAIEAEYADFRAVEIGKRDVFDDGFFVDVFAYAHHRIDDFVWLIGHAVFPGCLIPDRRVTFRLPQVVAYR